MLHSLQFGLGKNYATYMPIAHAYDTVSKSVEKGYMSCGIFIDLKKAFDAVSCNILSPKMIFSVFEENFLKFFVHIFQTGIKLQKLWGKYLT